MFCRLDLKDCFLFKKIVLVLADVEKKVFPPFFFFSFWSYLTEKGNVKRPGNHNEDLLNGVSMLGCFLLLLFYYVEDTMGINLYFVCLFFLLLFSLKKNKKT